MIAALRESKIRLSELVSLANSGEEIFITVHGEPKACLIPVGVSVRHRGLVARVERSPIEFRSSLDKSEAQRAGGSAGGSLVKALYWDTSCVLALYVPERISSQVSDLNIDYGLESKPLLARRGLSPVRFGWSRPGFEPSANSFWTGETGKSEKSLLQLQDSVASEKPRC